MYKFTFNKLVIRALKIIMRRCMGFDIGAEYDKWSTDAEEYLENEI